MTSAEIRAVLDGFLSSPRQDRQEFCQLFSEAEASEERAEAARQKAENDAKEAAERAEADKINAAIKAEQDRKDAIIEERNRVSAELAKRVADDEMRAADVEHRRTVNGAIMDVFMQLGIQNETAKSIIVMMVKGDIPHVTINY